MPRFIRAMSDTEGEGCGTGKTGDKKTDDSQAQGSASSSSSKKGPQSSGSSYDELRKAIAQKLDLELNVATELLVSYMMFEYKGSSTSYDEIADTHRSFTLFMKDLTEYYMRERTCLLLCTQAILADLGDESIIETFRTIISYKSWCLGLLKSVDLAKNEDEVVEILHCLILLMYQLPNETVPEFLTYFSNKGFTKTRESERMKMAEGASMYTAILITGITDCCSSTFPQEFGPVIRDFITKNFDMLLLNPHNIAPVFSAYDLFCKDDPTVTRKMKCIPCDPSVTFSKMLQLTECYGKESLYDRHHLSLVISASLFEAFEVLLANYDINHFGTNKEGFLILAKILQHNVVAERFLCGTPLALTALYTDATSIFPLDSASSLFLWKSLCMSVRSRDNCKTLIQGVAKLNCVAEFSDEDTSLFVRRTGEYGVVNVRPRRVYGIDLEKGLRGTLNTYVDESYISWELPSSADVSAFEVLLFIMQPMAEQLTSMDAGYNVQSSAFENYDYNPTLLHSVCDFVIQFMKSTDEQIEEITYLVHPSCIILESLIKNIRNTEDKIKLIRYLMGIVGAVNEFTSDKIALFNYVYDLLPGRGTVSVVENLILGRESVSQTKCEITLAFLDLMVGFAENERCWNQGHSSEFETKFLKSIGFIAENILSSSVTWRVDKESIRQEIYMKCMDVFIQVYSLESSDWTNLKRECLRFLIAPTREHRLLDCVIRPTEDDKNLIAVMTRALKLLLHIVRFEKRVLMRLDAILDGMIIPILGCLARHRLNPTIPTLAMMILKEVAANTTMSLLACFGNDEAAFRDVIIQRLDFTAEDINLKIAVLEFLTIIAQTQIGIIQCFFMDGVLESSIIDLIDESEDLSIACLRFFRSLFRQRLPLPRSRKNFWTHICAQIKIVKRGSKLEVITSTLHILTFELYTNGTNDSNFICELEFLLMKENFVSILEVIVSELNETSVKCLLSAKHFLTLVLGRPELSRLIPKDTLSSVQGLMLECFWNTGSVEGNSRILETLSEIVTIVTIPESATPEFMSDLLLKLIETFNYYNFSVQLSLLYLINKCFSHCNQILRDGVVENTLRILKKVLEKSVKIMQEEGTEETFPLLIVTATLIATIVQKQPIEVWGAAFQVDSIPISLLSISSLGVVKRKASDVVANCLAALITIAEHPHGCNLLPTTGMSKMLWLHLIKFTEEACDISWTNVFLLCLNLNSKLLASQGHQYLEEALSFWGLYAGFLNHKLSLMTNLMDMCVMVEDTDKGYNDMKAVLTCNAFVLNDILMLMPYIEDWQKSQPSEVFKAIRGVFFVLQEASSLLRQPLLLQPSVTYKSKIAAPEKLSPKLFEMQNKLWEICDVCMQILVKLKSKDEEFIEKNDLIPTMFQLGQLSIRALTKGERKLHSGTMTTRISSILEKVMFIVFSYTIPVLDDPFVDAKFQISFRRELGTEVVSLCDGIRRLAFPKNEFLITLCTKLESKFK